MQLRTEWGYPLDEITSAIQKCVRRGDEEQALWFAHEMESKFHQYLWRRLAIIACEDIGPANPLAITVVNACREAYYFHRNTNSRGASDPNYLSLAVLHLCRSTKSRACNDLQALILWERQQFANRLRDLGDPEDDDVRAKRLALMRQLREQYPVPDVALDAHTARGRQMGRGYEHWFEEGDKLVNEVGPNRYRERLRDVLLASRMNLTNRDHEPASRRNRPRQRRNRVEGTTDKQVRSDATPRTHDEKLGNKLGPSLGLQPVTPEEE